MIILTNKMTGFLLPVRFHAMCIWPFVLIRPDKNLLPMSDVLNHERIHARQQLEMAGILFFLWYGVEYFIRLMVYRDRMRAYKSLSHEREAFLNDSNPEYYRTRKPYGWVKYL